MQATLGSAVRAWGAKQYNEAKDQYVRLAAQIESIPIASLTSQDMSVAAEGLNNLAWLLATCPDETLRDPRLAVKSAQRAIDLVPTDGNTWNTLGVAHYRAGSWNEARNALSRSMELRSEGDAFDWFFLAMIEAQFGQKERANELYSKAVRWAQTYRPGDSELYRFQAEAALKLGLPQPEQLPHPRAPTVRPPGVFGDPMMLIRRGRNRIINPSLPAR
jgi:tetratricopeptide (TPR) repeat protein